MTGNAITPAQMAEARKLLKWSRARLAVRIGVSSRALGKFENEGRVMTDLDLNMARDLLASAGVEFIAEDGGCAGVRLQKPRPVAIPIEDLNASNDE